MNIADPFTMLSDIFDSTMEGRLTCNDVNVRSTAARYNGKVGWIDFELSCDCDTTVTIRYDGP